MSIELTFSEQFSDVVVAGREAVEYPPTPDEELLVVNILWHGKAPEALPPQAQLVHARAVGLQGQTNLLIRNNWCGVRLVYVHHKQICCM